MRPISKMIVSDLHKILSEPMIFDQSKIKWFNKVFYFSVISTIMDHKLNFAEERNICEIDKIKWYIKSRSYRFTSIKYAREIPYQSISYEMKTKTKLYWRNKGETGIWNSASQMPMNAVYLLYFFPILNCVY